MEKTLTNAVPNWKKIKELRFEELRVRGAQKLTALAERRGWSSLTKLPADAELLAMLDRESIGRELWSAQELLEHFRSRSAPKFFPGVDKQNATVEQLRARWPEGEREILERANRIMQGQFDLLGFCGLSFGQPIDWHLEPIANGNVRATPELTKALGRCFHDPAWLTIRRRLAVSSTMTSRDAQQAP